MLDSRSNLFEEWKSLVPKPRKLEADEKWNVFLSYRSVNRGWTLNLYDVLRYYEHKVFLDQCVLSAGDELIKGLEDSLANSQSGVLIWSDKSKDSDWVRKEYSVMERKASNGESFKFVPLRLDNSNLPDFAANRIFLDFSSYPDGPNGGELLRLLYAIVGKPLSEKAVRVAFELDEANKRSIARIKTAIKIGSAKKLKDLHRQSGPEWQTSAALPCQAANGLIKLGEIQEAISMLQQIEELFPNAIRPKQLRALALARRGENDDLDAAQEIIGELYELGEKDPETLGIYGRTWMDRYALSKNIKHLRTSRNLYAQAFDNAQDDYYTGINAAAKSVFIGTTEDIALADSLATKVQKIVGEDPVPGDYWMTATIGEVFLIKKNFQKASILYEAAVALAPEETGSHQSTWQQACRLMEKLQPSPEQRSMVRNAFDHLDDCT